MIRIIMDPYQVEKQQPAGFMVSNEETYIESRFKIRDALSKEGNIIIIVRNRKFINWYESLRNIDKVKIEEISPQSYLSRILNVDLLLIPFNDAEIIELDLINEAKREPPSIMITHQRDIKNWVLTIHLDRIWAESVTSLEHFSNICTHILSQSITERPRNILIEELVSEKKQEWENTTYGSSYMWLFENPKENAFTLYARQVIKNYDNSIKKDIINEICGKINNYDATPIFQHLDKLPPIQCNESLSLKIKLSDLIEAKWKKIFKEKYKGGKSEFRDIIIENADKMSGRIEGELNALVNFIKENASHFDNDLLNIIKVRFSEIFNKNIDKLIELIPPKLPTSPSQDWSWDQIGRWAVNEYFPYLKWAIRENKVDKTVEKYVHTYSDWLYFNYPKLKNEPMPLNYGTWVLVKKYIDEGYHILWVIIDNLPWLYVDDIKNEFEKNNFALSPPLGIIPILSMLPSETRVSKTALVAGKLPHQIDPNSNYKQLFEEMCKAKSIYSYLFIQDSDLKDGMLHDVKLTCCLINKLDLKAHRFDFDMEDDIKDALRRLVGYIQNFIMRGIEKNGISRDKIKIIVSTDHGSCVLPLLSRRVNIPKGAEPEKEHSRFVFLNKEEELDENWFYLNKENFGLWDNIGIVKGYAFVGNKRPTGLVHGGMTPEETIIPHIEFSLTPLDIKPIECNYIGEGVYLATKTQDVNLAVRNINEYDVRNVCIFISAYDLKIEINNIPSKSEISKSFSIILSKDRIMVDKESFTTLRGIYRFSCVGKEFDGPLNIRVRIRRIMEGPTEVEDLLGLKRR